MKFSLPIHFLYVFSFYALQNLLPKFSTLSNFPNLLQEIDFTEFQTILAPYNLTKGEVSSFFRLCDHERNDKLTSYDWHRCVKTFITPYKKLCLTSGHKNYLLTKRQLSNCLQKKAFNLIPKITPNKKQPSELLFLALKRNKEGMMNLLDYIFLRRLVSAWKECSVDDRLNKKGMTCSLTITTPRKRRFLPISNQVFDIAIQIYKTKIKENEAFLDFFSFARIAYLYYYFNEFELPFQQEKLSKEALIKGIEDQIVPTSINVEWASKIFYALDPGNHGDKIKLDFGAFAAIFHCLELYSEYSNSKNSEKKVFNEESMKEMIKEQEWDYFKNILIEAIPDTKGYKDKIPLKINETNENEEVDEKIYFNRFHEKKRKNENDNYKKIFKMFGRLIKKIKKMINYRFQYE